MDCCLCFVTVSSEPELEEHISTVHAKIFRQPERFDKSTEDGPVSRNVKNTRKKGDSWRKGRPKKNTKEGGKEDSNTDGQRSKAKKKTSLKGGNRPQNMCSGNGSKAGSIVKGQRRKRSKQEAPGVNPNRKRKRMKTELADNNKSNDDSHLTDSATPIGNLNEHNRIADTASCYSNSNDWNASSIQISSLLYPNSAAVLIRSTDSHDSNLSASSSNSHSHLLNIDPDLHTTVPTITDPHSGILKSETGLESNSEPEVKSHPTLHSVFHNLPNVSYDELLEDSMDLLGNLIQEKSSLEASQIGSSDKGYTSCDDQSFHCKKEIQADANMKKEPANQTDNLDVGCSNSELSKKEHNYVTEDDVPLEANLWNDHKLTSNSLSKLKSKYFPAESMSDQKLDINSIMNEDILKAKANLDPSEAMINPSHHVMDGFSFFKCHLCSFQTKSKFHLNFHLALIHQNEISLMEKNMPPPQSFGSSWSEKSKLIEEQSLDEHQLQKPNDLNKVYSPPLEISNASPPPLHPTSSLPMLSISTESITITGLDVTQMSQTNTGEIETLENMPNEIFNLEEFDITRDVDFAQEIDIKKEVNVKKHVIKDVDNVDKEFHLTKEVHSVKDFHATKEVNILNEGYISKEANGTKEADDITANVDIAKEVGVTKDDDDTAKELDIATNVDVINDVFSSERIANSSKGSNNTKRGKRTQTDSCFELKQDYSNEPSPKKPKNWVSILITKLEKSNATGTRSEDLSEANMQLQEDNPSQDFYQDLAIAKDYLKTRLKDIQKEIDDPPPLSPHDVLQLLKLEHQIKLEKENNRKLTEAELIQLRKLKDVEAKLSELKADHQDTLRCLAQTKDALGKMTEKFQQKAAIMSAYKISEERSHLENIMLKRDLEIKKNHLSSIQSILENILKNDTIFCGNEANAGDCDVIDDNDLVDIVNSILCQFGKSKEIHFEDIQKCLDEMTGLQKKKKKYKQFGLKMKEKVKILEEQNEDLRSKFEEKNSQLEHEIAEKNSTKFKLESTIKAKDTKILKMNEQMRTKHEEFQQQLDQLKGKIETKVKVVTNDKHQLLEITKELQAKVSDFEAENKHLKFVEINLRNEITLLEAKMMDNKFNVKVKVLEDRVESKDKEILKLKKQNEWESQQLNDRFRREKMELEKTKSALERKVTIKAKIIHNLQLKISDQERQRESNDLNEKTRKSYDCEMSKLRSELKGKKSILEVLRRSNFAIKEKYKNLSEELKQKEVAHRKAMIQHKSSLDMMKGQVLSKIRAKNEKINEMNQELKLKEDMLNSVKKQLSARNAKIAALKSSRRLKE